jgi:Tfp pilus assembly protein PilV
MLIKRILFFIGLAILLVSPSFAQTTADTQTFKQQLQQVRDQLKAAVQSGNQSQIQQLRDQENSMILQQMQVINAQKIADAKAHPETWTSKDPNDQWGNAQMQLKIQMQDAINSGDTKTAQQIQNQLAANAQQRFAQIAANKQAWLQAHPAEAARQAKEEEFKKTQLPLFFALGEAVKNGDTTKAQQIKAELAAARKQWMQTVSTTSSK